MSRLLIPLAVMLIAWPAAASAVVSPNGYYATPPKPLKGGPHVKRGTPYPDVRRQLIAQGFMPVHIVSWPGVESAECREQAWADVCAVYRETEACAGDAPLCRFLYRSRADGRYWIVLVEGETTEATVADMRHLQYRGSRLYEFGLPYVVIGPDGHEMDLIAPRKR